MKENKREAIKAALLEAGLFGVPRHVFEQNRLKFGTSFVRRLEELEAEYIIEKRFEGHFIVGWSLIGKRNPEPVASDIQREIYIGAVAGWDLYEVLR